MPRSSLFRRALLALPLLAVVSTGCAVDQGEVRRSAAPAPAGVRGTGVFMGGGNVDVVRGFESWTGGDVTHVGSYLDGSSWARWAEPSFARKWTGTGYQLVIGVPMLMQGDSLAAGANGAYDHHYRKLAANLVAAGQGRAILRLGWEFNGGWYPWRVDRNPSAFGAFWRRAVTAMRSVPGAGGLRFDWNPNFGRHIPAEAYPGDAYVDIIGFDMYDRSYSPAHRDPNARWQYFLEGNFGLNWLRDFARAHGKPMSFPEWALSHQHVPGTTHDNPVYVRNMAEFIRNNNVEYHMYFNRLAHDGDFRITSFPRSAAEYRARF